jgi:hypothetical protein
MSRLSGLPVCGHNAQAGSAGLSQEISSGHPQSDFLSSSHGSFFWQSQSGKAFLHFEQVFGFTFSHGHAGPVTTGSASGQGVAGAEQGQAAIAGAHEAIPKAITAAAVSFFIVIFTSLWGFFSKKPQKHLKKLILNYVLYSAS